MSKKRSVAFASVVAVLVFASWIDDCKSQKTTPKAMKPNSPVTTKKTIRDLSLTGRQHFDFENPFSKKDPFDREMEQLRETAGMCAGINEICGNKVKAKPSHEVKDPYYYNVLYLPTYASAEEIEAAYQKQAQQWNPANIGKYRAIYAEATERFKEISEAYKVLSDPKKKELYDKYGKEGLSRFVNRMNRGLRMREALQVVMPCCREKVLGIVPSPFKPRCRLTASSGDTLVCVEHGHEDYDNPPQGTYTMPKMP